MNIMEKKNEFKPYIPADKIVPEFTVTSIVIGIFLAALFRSRKRIPRTDRRYDSISFHSGSSYLYGYHPCDSS